MNFKNKKTVVRIIAVLIVVAVIIWFNQFAMGSEKIQQFAQQFGYIGIFFASVLSGFNVLVPIPIIGFYPFFLESGFSSWGIVATISAGMLIGDVFGYILGIVGRGVAQESDIARSIVSKFEALHNRHYIAPLIALFMYAAFVPLPNELVVIPMAFMGYQLRYMIIALFLGNILFNTLAAFGVFHVITIL